VLQSGRPSRSVTEVSLTITAALPLSQISVNPVTERAEPPGRSGAGTVTASLAWSTLLNSMSMPGKFTFGGSVSWKPAATFPKVGSTCGVSSIR
jgi:hypothetical protein